MTTYTQLQTDVQSWAIADDQAARVPTFITLAEERHRWGITGSDGERNQHDGAIRVRANERRARIQGNGTPYLPLPDPYLEHRLLQFVGATQRDRELFYTEPNNMSFNATWRPTRYTIERDELHFNGNVPDNLQVEMWYYVPFSPLSDENPSNWLSLNAYGCYLWAAIAEMHHYNQDHDENLKAETKYRQSLRPLMRSEMRARRSQGQLRVVMAGRSTP